MACLEPDVVLALVDGRLQGAALATVEAHVAACEACADRVAAADSGGWRAGARTQPGAEPLLRGTSIGPRYVVQELAGRGAMGEVYRARDRQLEIDVALKLLRARGGARWTAAAAGRLLDEARKLARVSHPNVVSVRDAGDVDGRVFMAMDLVEGETLDRWLRRGTRAWREILDTFLLAGRGLEAAHRAGLVHRDFKPENVMVGHDGAVRVMDFGLAEFSSGEDGEASDALDGLEGTISEDTLAFTRSGKLIGTPYYMSPEHFRGRPDARSDQFSFCVALYRAIYDEWPFPVPVASLPVLRQAIMAGRIREAPPGSRVPGWLRGALVRGLDPDPARRFSSMGELLDALTRDSGRRRRWSWLPGR